MDIYQNQLYSPLMHALDPKAERTLIAAMALQGLLSNSQRNHTQTWVCEDAVKFADQLIEELKKKGN